MPAHSDQSAAWRTSVWPSLIVLLVLTLSIRGSVLWTLRENLHQDPDAYRDIAQNLLQQDVLGLGGNGTPHATAYRPPLYPLVLAKFAAGDRGTISAIKLGVLHLLLGAGTVALTFLLTRLAVRNITSPVRANVAGLVAGLLVACDPILLNQQALVMTETLATFLAILSLWPLARFSLQPNWWNAAASGAAIGLAVLCRPTFLPWLALVGVGMLATRPLRGATMSNRLGQRALNFFVLAIVAAAVLAPWAIRNQQVFGKPMLTTTHGGYTLYLGNNPDFYAYLKSGNRTLPWTIQPDTKSFAAMGAARLELFTGSDGELRADAMLYDEANESIRNDRGGFVRACLYRVIQLWSPLPNKLSADESRSRMALRYATAAWYLGVYLLAMLGIWRLRKRIVQPPWLWGLMLCLVFTAVHTVYWSNLRMRAPLMPFVAMVAAASILPANSPRILKP